MIRMIALVSVALLLGMIPGTLVVKNCMAWPEYGDEVNLFCPSQPFTGSNCSLCHGATRSEPTDAKDAFLAGELCFFCPNDAPCTTGPTCTDLDGDGYAQEGGDCGPIDCKDTDASVHPGAAEVCTDGVDNDCNGLVDAADPNAVDCPAACTDADGDLYSVGGGDCGPVDCDDTDASINPGAAEDCTDGIDNNCNGLVDRDDPAAVGCTADCTDVDGDLYSIEGGDCGPVDCDDSNASINPGATENCTDGTDNNCDGLVDTADLNAVGCPATCTDADGDEYSAEGGDCGPADCDDADASVNPGATEDCTDGIDNDCNGLVDTADPNAVGCLVGCTDADGDLYSIEGGDCGPVDCDDGNASVNPGASEDCTDGIDNNCNSRIDSQDAACASDEREEECEGGRDFGKRGHHRECDGEDSYNRGDDEDHRDEGSRKNEENESDKERGEDRWRGGDSSSTNGSQDQTAPDQESLPGGTAPVGCSVIPASMGHGSPGSLIFVYSLVAGYIGLVRRVVRRKKVDRKDRT